MGIDTIMLDMGGDISQYLRLLFRLDTPALVWFSTVVPSVWGMDRWRHRSKGLVASLRYMGRCRSRQRTVGQGLYSVGHFDVTACLSGGLDVWDGGHDTMFFSP